MDDTALLSAAARYRDSAGFIQVNDTAYASALGGGTFINLYVSAPAFASYAAIEPDVAGTGVVLPEGALIVREVLDAAGNAQRLTLMAKGPAGYNPDLGDYWFAVTDLDGTPLVEDGISLVGQLEECYGCHIPRSGDDFLFGVPADNRKALGGPSTPPGDGEEPPPQTPPVPPGPICGDFVCEAGESCITCAHDCSCDDGDHHDDDDDHHDDDDGHHDDGRGRGRGRGGRG